MSGNTVRDRVLVPLNNARAIISALGFRGQTLTVITRTWSGGRQGVGSKSDARLTLVPDYKARVVSLQEVASSAGTLRDGDWKVGPITPAVAVLNGSVAHVGTGTGTVAAAPNVLPAGVIQGAWNLVVQITGSGGVGVGTYRYSVNGGTTYSSPATLPASLQVPGIGVLLTFAGTFVSADTYSLTGASVGYTVAQLRPEITTGGIELLYEISGSEGALLHSLERADFDRSLRTTLFLRRMRQTP